MSGGMELLKPAARPEGARRWGGARDQGPGVRDSRLSVSLVCRVGWPLSSLVFGVGLDVSAQSKKGAGRPAFTRRLCHAGRVLSESAEASHRGDTGGCRGLPGWVPCGLHCVLYITVCGARSRDVSPYATVAQIVS